MIKHIKYVSGIEYDFDVLKKHFFTNAQYKYLLMPNQIDIQELNLIDNVYVSDFVKELKSKYNCIVQIGNSGTLENNHLDVLYKLKELNYKDFCIICPLAYGDKIYIKDLIEKGKELFGERFIPITEYMNYNDYFSLLGNVDIAIMNHNRQQAIGNILLLLYLGKKIFLKKNITTYAFLSNLEFKIFDVSDINRYLEHDFVNSNELLLENKEKAIKNFSEDAIKKMYDKYFK